MILMNTWCVGSASEVCIYKLGRYLISLSNINYGSMLVKLIIGIKIIEWFNSLSLFVEVLLDYYGS